jgi:hypothetical protein
LPLPITHFISIILLGYATSAYPFVPFIHVLLRDFFVPRIYIFIDFLPVSGDAQLIMALGEFAPHRIPDKIINGCFGFLLIRSVIKLGDFGFDPQQ